MALNDDAVLVPGNGNYLIAPAGTAVPTDLSAPDSPWAKIGHTSISDILGISSEGGEATILGTLQNRSLRTTYSARQETFAINLQQFDAAGLKLYYGSNMVTVGDLLGVPNLPEPTEKAWLSVFVDGSNIFAMYAPLVEVYRGDDFSIADTETLASLPLAIKPKQYQTNTWSYAVTPLGEA